MELFVVDLTVLRIMLQIEVFVYFNHLDDLEVAAVQLREDFRVIFLLRERSDVRGCLEDFLESKLGLSDCKVVRQVQ